VKNNLCLGEVKGLGEEGKGIRVKIKT